MTEFLSLSDLKQLSYTELKKYCRKIARFTKNEKEWLKKNKASFLLAKNSDFWSLCLDDMLNYQTKLEANEHIIERQKKINKYLEENSRFDSPKEWEEQYPESVKKAKADKVYNACIKLMFYRKKTRTFKECYQISLKYKTIKDFREHPKDKAIFYYARDNKWIEKMNHLQKAEKTGKWTRKLCETIIQEFKIKSLKDWERKHENSYKGAKRQKFHRDLIPAKSKKKYNLEKLLTIAQKQGSLLEWIAKDNKSYKAASRYGYLEKIKELLKWN